MNPNQRCMITILEHHGDNLTTAKIIELANNYPTLCRGCSSGSAVIAAGIYLMERDIVTREISKGGFVWSLKKNLD